SPQYAPPTPAGNVPPTPPGSVPPGHGTQAPPPEKKSKTLIIVLAVLGVLLLCCIGSSIAGFSLFKSGIDSLEELDMESEISTVIEEDEPSSDTLTEPSAGPGERAEWTDFRPELADPSIYAEPTAEQAALIEEIHTKLYPGFKIEDTLAEPGGEDAENYYPDMLYVKASLASDPSVRIAYYLWTDSAASLAAGVNLDEGNTETYETVAKASSGTSYIYDHENLMDLMEGTMDANITDVLAQADEDFPGYVAIIAGGDGEDFGIVLTRWEAFPDLEYALVVMYTPDGEDWTVSSVEDW
ncbi:MAG: hypothetical protein RBS17_08445, partial [Coriobacteriia bacterium]|nr:hypothetical protein [Coriobacteriia bacterium]